MIKKQKYISKLKNELRNEFEHYVPGGWSIEKGGLPKITIDALDVIRLLSLEIRAKIHLRQVEKDIIEKTIDESKSILKKIKF